MRVASDTSTLEVDPGEVADVVVSVFNTSQVIDGVTARVIGLPEESVRTQPVLLPLFPDASGQLTLSLAVPATHPAGRHPLTVEVVSHGARLPSQFLDLSLDVAARPAMSLTPRPRVLRAHRQGRFVLELANLGNLALEVTLKAIDVDRAARSSFAPEIVRLEAGAVVPVLLTVRGPRMFVGAEVDRAVTVEATAHRIEPLTEPDAKAEIQATHETTVRLRQRPRLSRGLLTALILVGIVALWAGVFLLGLAKVFSGDPTTKEAPASFFAASAVSATTGSGGSAAGTTGGGSAAAPAGALPKNGQLPAGIGAVVNGTVTAASNHKPVGRILVEALRQGRSGLQLVSSAATQADGTYTLAGLFPTSYYIRFSAAGYPTVWYPAATDQNGAQQIATVAQGSTQGIDAVVTGQPATISGSVDPGDTLTPVVTTVSALTLEGAGTTPVAVTTTAADGTYSLANLPAPETYQLSFTATGYQPTTIVDTVSGGQQRLEPTVQLAVGTGQISGTVTDGTNPLGGVTVTTTVGGKALTLTTPTTGTVGAFVLGNLPTPATYVVSFQRAGYGAQTTVVDLAAGQSSAGLMIPLAVGTGSVSGRLVDGNGNGLGGATVTVGGATVTAGGAAAPSTTTLTAGSVGSFAINGLAAPGTYTLTFTLGGFAPASVPVTLSGVGAPATVTVTLGAQLGRISGVVTGPDGTAFVGAKVSATDGRQTWTTTSTSASGSGPSGGYLIDALQPGSYSVTVTAADSTQQTGVVTVVAGTTATLNLQLGG